MIHAGAFSAITLIGKFLRDSGYDTRHLGYELDLGDGLYANHENLEPLLARTEGTALLPVLARLFFVGWPVAESVCNAVLPAEFLGAAFECGLLGREGGELVTSASLVPFRTSIIACDSNRLRVSHSDIVMGPSSSTHLPARLAVGGKDETTLDLGTGGGALALEAARYSRRVIGTDINPRTLVFAEFNAVLNDVSNIEWRCGDAFSPVAGERFSRIVANPPFFLSPEKALVYCDSPLELDGFSAALARDASGYLEEGGFYQMICEWVEIEGESWEQRLRDWTAGSGCDVLVLLAPSMDTLAYSAKRTQEARTLRVDGVEGHFQRQFKYLKDHRVKNVMAGVISMRRRGGSGNWFAAVRTDPVGPAVGPDVQARFDALTFLATSKEDQILQSKLQLAADVVLDKRSAVAFYTAEWRASTVELVKQKGLTDRLRLDESVSGFLPLFDGVRTLDEIADLVVQRSHVSLEEARRRCLELARRLIQSNFVSAF